MLERRDDFPAFNIHVEEASYRESSVLQQLEALQRTLPVSKSVSLTSGQYGTVLSSHSRNVFGSISSPRGAEILEQELSFDA